MDYGNGSKRRNRGSMLLYTRQDALNDGILIDCSLIGRRAGIECPVALTRAVWDCYVLPPEGVVNQNNPGQLWDILWAFSVSVPHTVDDCFLFWVMLRNNDTDLLSLVKLRALIAPGDSPAPVITIMLPHED